MRRDLLGKALLGYGSCQVHCAKPGKLHATLVLRGCAWKIWHAGVEQLHWACLRDESEPATAMGGRLCFLTPADGRQAWRVMRAGQMLGLCYVLGWQVWEWSC